MSNELEIKRSIDQQRSTLSDRGQAAVNDREHPIWEVISNLWHAEHNSEGFVSLGVAENALMHQELSEYLNSRKLNLDSSALTYGDGPTGSKRVRAAMARFLNQHLKPIIQLQPEHLILTNGCSSGVEHCSWALADGGDALLLGRPFYGMYATDVCLRPGTELIPVSFGGMDPMSLEAVEKYEDAVVAANQKRQIVKGIILCSPHNPLGRCYTQEVLCAYMRICQKYQVHLICDEIYALSVWKNNEDSVPPSVKFTSILSIDTSGLIDPCLLHVLWGTSKDFGMNGVRVGCLISQHNKAFLKALISVALYSNVSSVAEHITANILEDDNFTDWYIRSNRARLSESYSLCVKILRQHGIEYSPGSNAAFFLWVNLGKAYTQRHSHKEMECTSDITESVMECLLDHKLFLARGDLFGSEKPGWFRIVFTQPKEVVEEGMKRLVKAIEAYNPR